MFVQTQKRTVFFMITYLLRTSKKKLLVEKSQIVLLSLRTKISSRKNYFLQYMKKKNFLPRELCKNFRIGDCTYFLSMWRTFANIFKMFRLIRYYSKIKIFVFYKRILISYLNYFYILFIFIFYLCFILIIESRVSI